MVRVLLLSILFLSLSGTMDALFSQSEQASWDGKKATLTLKKGKTKILPGIIIKKKSNGVVFNPDRLSIFHNAPEKLYPFSEVDMLVEMDGDTLYMSEDATAALLRAEALNAQLGSTFIQLNTGEILHGKVEFKKRALGPDYILFEDAFEYETSDLRALQTEKNRFVRVKGGLFQEGKWARQVEKGEIDIFILEPTAKLTAHYNIATGTISIGVKPEKFSRYFSKDGGDVQKTNFNNLKIALQDNQQSMKYLNEYDRLTNVRNGLIFSGIGIAIISIANAKRGEGLPGAAALGLCMATGSWIPHFKRGEKINDAIKAYNR